jgi:hypothetical protein
LYFIRLKLTSKECLINLFEFFKKEKRLPIAKEEVNLYSTLRLLRNGKYDEDYSELVQEIKDLCDGLRIDLYSNKATSEECLINLFEFLKKEKKLPNTKKEKNLHQIFYKLRKGKYDEEYPELVQEIKDLCNKLNLSLNINGTK